MAGPMTLADLNAVPAAAFVQALGGIFEHSPWVAAAVADHRPFGSVDALHRAMVAAVAAAPPGRQLDLIRAHPDLAGKAARAGALTEPSTAEQAGAGLDRLTDAEFERFGTLNTAYMARFGFPFIVAVKGLTKHDILTAFETRLPNDPDTEKTTALQQVARIARFRLEALIPDA